VLGENAGSSRWWKKEMKQKENPEKYQAMHALGGLVCELRTPGCLPAPDRVKGGGGLLKNFKWSLH